MIKFWKSAASGSRSRNISKHSSTLRGLWQSYRPVTRLFCGSLGWKVVERDKEEQKSTVQLQQKERGTFASITGDAAAVLPKLLHLLQELCQPVDNQSPSLTSHLTHTSSSSSSPLSPSITPSLFSSRLKTCLFYKSFAPQSHSPL